MKLIVGFVFGIMLVANAYCAELLSPLGHLHQNLQELSDVIKVGPATSAAPKKNRVDRLDKAIERLEKISLDKELHIYDDEAILISAFDFNNPFTESASEPGAVEEFQRREKDSGSKTVRERFPDFDDKSQGLWVNFVDRFNEVRDKAANARLAKKKKDEARTQEVALETASAKPEAFGPKKVKEFTASELEKIKASSDGAFEIPRSLFNESYKSVSIKKDKLNALKSLKELYDFAFNFLFEKLAGGKKALRRYDSYGSFDDSNLMDNSRFMKNIAYEMEKAQEDFISESNATAAVDRIITALFYREFKDSGSWGRLAGFPTDAFKDQDKKVWHDFIAVFVEKAKSLEWKLVFKVPSDAIVVHGEIRKTLNIKDLHNETHELYTFAVQSLYDRFAGNPKKETLSDKAHIQEAITPAYIGQLLWNIYDGTYPQYASQDTIFILFILESQNAGTWKKGVNVENEKLEKYFTAYKKVWDSFMKDFIAKAQSLKLID